MATERMTSLSSLEQEALTEDIRRGGELIRSGRLVAFPTETVYGLGANALDPEAVRRVYEAKGRPSTSPMIVHVASMEMARKLVASWPPAAEKLTARFWPGPLTLVLPKAACIPDVVTSGTETVALRMPDHPLTLALIREAGVPVVGPSANRFTKLSPTTAQHVRDGLGDRVDLILDGGPTRVGIESTILSLAVGPPRLLRPGMITQTAIEALIGPIEVGAHLENENAPHPSPGLHRKHYSPATQVVIVNGGSPPSQGRGVYLYRERPAAAAKSVQMPVDAPSYAAVLYGTLHREDTAGWDWIAVERLPAGPQWAGIADRLKRAAAKAVPPKR